MKLYLIKSFEIIAEEGCKIGADPGDGPAWLMIVPTPAPATIPEQAPQSHGGTGDPPPRRMHSTSHASEQLRGQVVVSEGATVTLKEGSEHPVMQDARISELERKLRELTDAATPFAQGASWTRGWVAIDRLRAVLDAQSKNEETKP